MVVLQSKGTQQSSRDILLQSTSYDSVRKRTVIPIQYINKECMVILNQNKVMLLNDETSTKNPDYSSVIYLTAAKVVQCTLVAEVYYRTIIRVLRGGFIINQSHIILMWYFHASFIHALSKDNCSFYHSVIRCSLENNVPRLLLCTL